MYKKKKKAFQLIRNSIFISLISAFLSIVFKTNSADVQQIQGRYCVFSLSNLLTSYF